MANISGFLQNILSARFGKDVRQSIHDAIEEIDKVADTAKDSATAMAKTATEKASEASGYASSAKTSEENAKSYMKSAKTSENNSKTSETNAKTSETNAKVSEINAKVSEENAQAVFESLPEDYGTLSNEFYEVAIKQTASGEEIHATDSANAKVREFAMFGKAKQQTTSGNQLLNYDAWKRAGTFNGTSIFENNGVTITATADDAFTNPWTNGYPEEAKIYVEEGEVITLSWEEATNANGTIFIFPNGTISGNVQVNNNSKKTLSYTVSSGVEFVTFRFGVNNAGDTISYKNIMLNKGSEPLPYEPYTGGQPSPSPDYPQEIEVAGASGSVVVKSCGKNKLDTSKNTIGFIYEDGRYVDLQGYLTSDFIKTNGKTAISANSYVGNPYIRVYLYDSKKNFIKRELLNLTPTTLSKIVDNIGYIRVCYDNAENMRVDNVQVEHGDVTPYEPYKETTATIQTTDFAGIPVASGGNYTDSNGQQWICDEIVKYADGSGEKIQRVYIEEVTTVHAMDSTGLLANLVLDYLPMTHANSNTVSEVVLCDKALAKTLMSARNSTNGVAHFIQAIYFRNGNIEQSKAGYDAWLTENPIKVAYALAEPIRTPLTAEELAEIEKLSTFYPVTNISNDADCGMEVTYLADSKLYIDNRLAQIEQALIANI